MDVSIEPGKYVLAVSGGVDSMVLLDLLSKQPGLELVVAHFDHGIRTDSAKDRKLVGKMAQKLGLKFVYEQGHLGGQASEATARDARYKFLHKVQKDHHAKAIITAHHQDDVLETVIINLLRGTGRLGLTALKSTNDIVRPLLSVSKRELLAYAQKYKLVWHEDSTNSDTHYLRNYVRQNVLSKLSAKQRQQFVDLLNKTRTTNAALDQEITSFLGLGDKRGSLSRKNFGQLPHGVALEVMAGWLRQNKIRGFDKKLLEQLVIAAKTLKTGKKASVNAKHFLIVNKTDIILN